ncbi:MAG: hypothetical protein ACFFAN_00175 [Promethearchaeota archaeon]
MKNWVKLKLFYLGRSKKKHYIFRAKQWNKGLEKIFKQPVFSEKYEKVGYIKDIFGSIKLPFISIQSFPGQEFNPNDSLYTKIQ